MATQRNSVATPVPAASVSRNVCPTCGQAVSHLKHEEIKAKLAALERERAAETQRQIAAGVAAAKATVESAAQAAIKKAKAEAQAQVDKVKRATTSQVAAARAEAKEQVETALKKRIEAGEAAEKELAALKASHTKELATQRAALEAAADKGLRAVEARHFRETQRMQATVDTLKRRLERKTADERGEGGEVDVFDALKDAFPVDRIRRVKKGDPGADIVHEIVRSARVIGKIVYDAKDRDAWRNDYVSKLKADQLAEGADHAILATRVFPAGTNQIARRDGVIIVNPARVVTIAHILRDQIEQADTLRLSRQARDRKAAELLNYITSERCGQLFERIESQTEALLELDVTDKKAHDKTWGTRGTLIRSIERAGATLQLEIDRILGTEAKEQSA
jgi:hypothetical protein